MAHWRASTSISNLKTTSDRLTSRLRTVGFTLSKLSTTLKLSCESHSKRNARMLLMAGSSLNHHHILLHSVQVSLRSEISIHPNVHQRALRLATRTEADRPSLGAL